MDTRRYRLLLLVVTALLVVAPVFAANVAVPGENDWIDHGKVIAHGSQGAWDWRVGGAISPSSMIRLGDKYVLYYVGASGARPSDDGPAFRRLGAASCQVSADCTQASNWVKFAGNPVITHQIPAGCEEAGIFGAAATVKDATVYLYYGAMTGASGAGCTSVSTDIYLATSADGFNFTSDPGNPVIDHNDPVYGGGDEIFPEAVLFNPSDSTWYLYYGIGGTSEKWNIGVAWGSSPTNVGSGGNSKLFVDDGPNIQGMSVADTGDDYVSFRWQTLSTSCPSPPPQQNIVQVGDMTWTDPSTLIGTRGPDSSYPYDGLSSLNLGTVFFDSAAGTWFLWHQDQCPLDPSWADSEGKDLFLKTAGATTGINLVILASGTGSGTVNSDPTGIDCPSDCQQSYPENTAVALTAVPNAGSTFVGWSGDADCSDGQVILNANRSCTATFDLVPGSCVGLVRLDSWSTSPGTNYALADLATGESLYTDRSYTVTSFTSGLTGGTLVQTANDDKDVTSANHLTMTLCVDATVYIAYDNRATSLPTWLTGPEWILTPETLTDTTSGASPRNVYSAEFAAGQIVLGGNHEGGDTGAGSNYSVVVRSSDQATLTVGKAGTGSGSVASAPAGIDCGIDCQEDFVEGSQVSLLTSPDLGSQLDSWTGDGDCSDSSLTMDADKTCTAMFEPCTLPVQVDLPAQSVSGVQLFEACNILTAGTGFVIEGSGRATLRAGNFVALGAGFTLHAGGTLEININP